MRGEACCCEVDGLEVLGRHVLGRQVFGREVFGSCRACACFCVCMRACTSVRTCVRVLGAPSTHQYYLACASLLPCTSVLIV